MDEGRGAIKVPGFEDFTGHPSGKTAIVNADPARQIRCLPLPDRGRRGAIKRRTRMDDKSSRLLERSSKNHRRRGMDLRGPWLCLITRADTTRIIRAAAVTAINQVGAEVSGLRCLTADHRCDAVNANIAAGHHIEAKFAIIISGLPRAQKCSAKTCSFLFGRCVIALEWTSLRAISEWPITARHSNRYVGDVYALLFTSYITKGQGAKTSKKKQKAEVCRSPLLTERCQLSPRRQAPLSSCHLCRLLRVPS